jgi:hypothetical protein
VDHDPHMDDDQIKHALAHILATDPEAIPAIIQQLPDPRAVAVLKDLAPGIAAMHRHLTRLETLRLRAVQVLLSAGELEISHEEIQSQRKEWAAQRPAQQPPEV